MFRGIGRSAIEPVRSGQKSEDSVSVLELAAQMTLRSLVVSPIVV
jgi:hypothetical protein